MKLTFEQIRGLTVGAIRTEECDGALNFYKCTQKQIDAWYQKSESLGNRASCSTGVRLDFHTNSQHLGFATPAPGKYEVLVDGLLYRQIIVGEGKDAEVGEAISMDLRDPLGNQKAEYRVILHLPSHQRGALSFVELDDGAYATRHVFDRKILIIGDSITQGWNSAYDSFSYASRLSRFFNAESVIQGIGGAYYHESTFDTLPFDPDLVILAYGTNDYGHNKTMEQMRGHVSAYLDLVGQTYGDKKIVVISPIWRSHVEKPMGRFEDCRAIVAEEAEKRGFCHVDGLSLVPGAPQFFADGLHPNDLGFSLYSANLCQAIWKLL